MSDTLSTLRALEAAATPGRWYSRLGGEPGYITAGYTALGEIYAAKTDAHRDPNLDLIIAARNALPALLRVAEAARAFIELDKAERPGLPRDVSLAVQRLAAALEEVRP